METVFVHRLGGNLGVTYSGRYAGHYRVAGAVRLRHTAGVKPAGKDYRRK